MAYAAAVGLNRVNRAKLDRCAAAQFRLEPSEPFIQLGEMAIDEIWQMHIAAAANAVCPGLAAATKNREVYAPIAAVLHWAADNKCATGCGCGSCRKGGRCRGLRPITSCRS